jgi:hypothetical protein
VVPVEVILGGVEKAVSTLPVEAAEEVRQETVRNLKMARKLKNNVRRAEKLALQTLRRNADLTVLPADKGNATVILNTSDYTEKVLVLLDDPAYKKLAKDPTQPAGQRNTSLI